MVVGKDLNIITSTYNDIQSNVLPLVGCTTPLALLSNCRELDAPSLYVLLLILSRAYACAARGIE